MNKLKDLMIEAAIEDNFRSAIKSHTVVPKFIDIYNSSVTDIENATKLDQIPSIEYKSDTSISDFDNEIQKITKWLTLARQSISPLLEGYKAFSNSYQDIAERIFNDAYLFKNRINSILTPNCYFCEIMSENQSKDSNAGRIGKYLTLPFYLHYTKMYTDSIVMRASSPATIAFSNIENVSTLPLKEDVAIKISNSSQAGSVSISARIRKTSANAIYLKFLNNINTITIKLYNSSSVVYSKSYYDSEIFVNFEPVEFDLIVIDVQYDNSNTDKPFSIQLSSFEIFKNIQFSRTGAFESKHIPIEKINNINGVKISYANQGDATQTNVSNLISLTPTESEYVFNKLYSESDSLDLSVYKVRYSRTFNEISTTLDTTNNSLDIFQREFFKILITKEDEDFWFMDYKNAMIYHGLASHYAVPFGSITTAAKLPYENWTKVDNYWKTMLVNFEDAVSVDIGSIKIKLNGVEVSGKISIPIGISEIEVHDKDIDFKFGKDKVSFNNDGLVTKSTVYNDPLFPFNLVYMFSGLPAYSDTTGLAEPITTKRFTLNGLTTIYLNEPFFPLSIQVSDGTGKSFSLQLSKGLYKEGTYSVEPNSGKIRIFPYQEIDHEVNITYRRASLMRRPCGIMFNRLLTFMPIKALLGMPYQDEVLFTIDGNPEDRNLLVQKIPTQTIEHSQIVFNRQEDFLYGAIRLEMETKNRFLTPIINDVFIAGV